MAVPQAVDRVKSHAQISLDSGRNQSWGVAPLGRFRRKGGSTLLVLPLRRSIWSVTSSEGGKASVIEAAAAALTGFTAPVTGCLGQFLYFCLQKHMEHFLCSFLDQFFDLALDHSLAS